MSDVPDHFPGQSGEPQAADPAVFDLGMACESMELTRAEVLVLIPQARIEIRLKMDAVRQALSASDLGAVVLNSHTIKSVTAALGVEPARLAAECLEVSALAGDHGACGACLQGLEQQTACLLTELDKL